MSGKLNPHLSIDCVVIGFNYNQLKVLLAERTFSLDNGKEEIHDFKLPGDLINYHEELDKAAARILNELTGLENIFLKQFQVFDSPGRIASLKDIGWLRQSTGLPIDRVVTIGYYSLIKIDDEVQEKIKNGKARWFSLNEINELPFDHLNILNNAMNRLKEELVNEPIVFELLPDKFTLRQLQNIYECLFNVKLDNRNFRKKISKKSYIIPLNEKQKGVAHKPATYYRFNKSKYLKEKENQLFIHI